MSRITLADCRGWLEGSDISIRIASLAVVTCWAFAACSSTPAAQDGATDAKPAKDAAGDRSFTAEGVCLIPLDAVQPFGGCRPTYDDSGWRTQVCPSVPVDPSFIYVSEQACTGYRLRKFDLGTHGWTCYYDPGSGALVAGYFVDDVPDLCDDTAASVQAGDIPTKGTCNDQVRVDSPCNVDGGADGSSHDGP